MKTKILYFCFIYFFLISINVQTQPPIAVNDTATVLYNTETDIMVRENDSNPEGGNFKVDTVFYSGDANVSFNSWWISYTGATEIIRKDSFQYVIRNTIIPLMYDTAWVFINIRQKHYDFLDINNINAHMGKNGYMFFDNFNGMPGFEVPVGSNNHSIFWFNPWLIGHVNDTLKMNAFLRYYYYYDFANAGPIMDEEWYSEYDEQWDRVWKINRWDIIYHMNHWQNDNYEPKEVISNWPAHGNPEKGQAFYLAPFYDYNNDGIYNPMDGDFPEIKGDQAIFLMYNLIRQNILDNSTLYSNSFTEVHCLFYAFNCEADSALEHTVFANIKFINRSNDTYTDTYFGLLANLDIGNEADDYIGCDVTRNSFFAYNGDNFDESNVADSGYGSNLAAQSVTLLKGIKMDDDGLDNTFGIEENQSINGLNFGDGIIDNEYWGMNHFIYRNNSYDPQIDDINKYYRYLRSIWGDDTPLTYGGSGYDPNNPNVIPTRFAFPGTSDPYFFGTGGTEVPEWTEITEGNLPADRRGIASTGPFTLLPYDTAEVDLAFVFALDYTGSGNVAPITIMKERIDSIRSYYLAGQTPCNDFAISVEELEKEELPSFFSVYPNPFSDLITLDNQSNESMEIVIYNLLGKELMRSTFPTGKTRIDLSHLRDNALIIKAISGDRIEAKKLLRIR